MIIPTILSRAFSRQQRRNKDNMDQIAFAAGNLEMVKIDYDSKSEGRIERTIRPYELKPHRKSGTEMLYATDTLHGAGTIHSFIAGRIRSVSPTTKRYRPVWPVKL